MTGSEKVVYKLVDLVVKSMDDSVEVELCRVRGKVKTVSRKLTSCIVKGGDLACCPHLVYEH